MTQLVMIDQVFMRLSTDIGRGIVPDNALAGPAVGGPVTNATR